MFGPQYSGTVHKRVEFLVCDDKALEARTKHVRKAEKFGVPIVSYQYVEECIRVVRFRTSKLFHAANTA